MEFKEILRVSTNRFVDLSDLRGDLEYEEYYAVLKNKADDIDYFENKDDLIDVANGAVAFLDALLLEAKNNEQLEIIRDVFPKRAVYISTTNLKKARYEETLNILFEFKNDLVMGLIPNVKSKNYKLDVMDKYIAERCRDLIVIVNTLNS